jgi:hypothetical protein
MNPTVLSAINSFRDTIERTVLEHPGRTKAELAQLVIEAGRKQKKRWHPGRSPDLLVMRISLVLRELKAQGMVRKELEGYPVVKAETWWPVL